MLKIPLLLSPLPFPSPPLIPKGGRKKNPKSWPKERGGGGLWRSKNDEEFVDQKTKENC